MTTGHSCPLAWWIVVTNTCPAGKPGSDASRFEPAGAQWT